MHDFEVVCRKRGSLSKETLYAPLLNSGPRLGDYLGWARTCLSHRSGLARRHAGELNPTFAADLRFHFLSGSTLGFDPHSDAHAFSLALGSAWS